MSISTASIGPALANHLWQSTAFAVAAWLLTLALRRNRARVRHAVWLAASLKFLVPFSLLIAAGNLLPHPKQPIAPVVYSAMNAVEEPFPEVAEPRHPAVHVPTLRERVEAIVPNSLAVLWALGASVVLLMWVARWRVVRRTRREAEPAHDGRELEILRRVEARLASARRARPLPLRLSAERMEPGVFGTVRHTLVWPKQLSARLDDEHIEAILAHELMHVHRRDNLTAALHMLIETIFWFHPLVWWMERPIVKEREQACDEAVMRLGGDAQTYTESLLKTCRFCLESPVACVAGVTGGELDRRVRSVLELRPRQLGRASCAALFVVIVGVIAAPVALGLARMPLVFGQILKATGARPSFEVTAIHLLKRPALPPGGSPPGTFNGEPIIRQSVMKFSPGREGAQTSDHVHLIVPVGVLIAQAYGLPPGSDGRADGRIAGGPDWMTNDTGQYDIQAKISEQDYATMKTMTAQQQREQVNLMKQSLLEDRFKLKVHFETRELPAYALVVAKGGPKLTRTNGTEATTLSSTQKGSTTELSATSTTMAAFAESPLLSAGTGSRTVIDETGLKGAYSFTLKWADPTAAQEPSDEPMLLTAIEEQLGLKLVPTKGPVEVIVIDHIEKPTVDGGELQPLMNLQPLKK